MEYNPKNRILDYWACIYVALVLGLSIITTGNSMLVFVVYFALAIPFINSIEHYVAISLLLSTISYYFVGAYEDIYSVYTILMVLILAKIIVINKGILHYSKSCLLPTIILMLLAIYSYFISPFHYTMGVFRIIYLLLLSVFLGNFVKLDISVLYNMLAKLAVVMSVGYFITVFINGTYINGRLTLANDVNTNTFGMSCAQLICILVITAILNKKNRMFKIVLILAVALLALLSGSRGALLASVLSCAIVTLMYGKRNNRLSITVFKMCVIGTVLLGLLYMFITMTGFDTTRFQLSKIISSGGANRTLIYSKVLSYVFKEGYWKFGYGPGHDCSSRVILDLMNLKYAHTHNIFIEALGEMGIGALVLLIWCLIKSFKNLFTISSYSNEAYLIIAMLLCMLINGMAESYYCGAILWLLLSIGRNSLLKAE